MTNQTQTNSPEFIVYTRGACRYCDEAKYLLTAKGMSFTAVEITDELKPLFLEAFSTVPQIYHKGTYVGGFDDLKEYTALND